MTRTTFTIAVAFLCSAAPAAPLVTYESACECRDNHGKHRWAVIRVYDEAGNVIETREGEFREL